jgi:hypothetical protein
LASQRAPNTLLPSPRLTIITIITTTDIGDTVATFAVIIANGRVRTCFRAGNKLFEGGGAVGRQCEIFDDPDIAAPGGRG